MDSWSTVRTDLALEARESIEDKAEGLHGVTVEEHYDEACDVHITKVVVETKNGAKMLGKPMGVYITLEAPAMTEPEEDYHQEISEILAQEIRDILPEPDREQSILVVGLGNREVTADSLGPNVVDNLFINRHIVREYGKVAYNRSKMHQVSSLIPGVMAKTGMESAEIIKGVIGETKPDMVIVIDALAARSTKRLNRTIQITNTGIHPGSGVGNHRNAITQESLHVPVLALGVPTVVDAATIVGDAMGERPVALKELNNMYVTTKDVDQQIQQISHILCDGINKALNYPEES
ncbi:MAG: GPR endopeptidase [Lachnospiraceae bacterium]|nr:GPR endopeptidase [Lachnospiraceae bacterium]MBD5485127.1 GPR endopeptidase [Lachnospiraceae bacterium]MBD5505798.1 GPR endopeptidase [Lachnospiraceae bacterium]MDE7258959.1 GPR endopeptidase [Lachnospiraceae bacterium]